MQEVPSAIPREAWFKSSHSGAGATECVEAAFMAGCAVVRDSKAVGGAVLAFSRSAWAGFVVSLRDGALA